MTLNIELPADLKTQLIRYSALLGKTPEEIVVELVAEKYAARPIPKKLSKEEFAQRLKAFTKLHPQVTHFVDDSRESIYEGRGE